MPLTKGLYSTASTGTPPTGLASLFAWGANSNGNLGIGNHVDKSSPTHVGTDSWTMVAASTDLDVTLAIKTDGSLWGWGNTQNNLTLGFDGGSTSNPSQVGTSSWSMIAAGNAFMAAIKPDGSLWTWGRNGFGQLGQGDSGNSTDRSSPTQVGTDSWTMVATGHTDFDGGGFIIAIKADGSLWSWGLNDLGQLGLGDNTSRSSPTLIDGGTWSAVTVGSYGGNHTLAIRSDGTLWSWGLNVDGQLGQGIPIIDVPNDTNSPAQVGVATNWTKISAGGTGVVILPIVGHGTSAGIQSDGSLWTWGSFGNGQLGQDPLVDTNVPGQVGTDSWTAVSAGNNSMAGITVTGALFVWGGNQYGELGTGDTIDHSTPVQIGSESWIAVSVSAGSSDESGDFIGAIRSDNKLFTVGANDFGQLGFGDTLRRTAFTQVGNTSWTSVRAGEQFMAGIQSDDTIWTWGRNDGGVLGLNRNVTIAVPILIDAGPWTSVTVGEQSAGIQSDGSLWTWGYNPNGELGQGGLGFAVSPIQVGADSWSVISTSKTSGSFAVAIKSNNTLWAWGDNSFGQLGLSDTTQRSSPVQIGSSSWTAVSAGNHHVLAVRAGDGGLFAWGNNVAGQLGDGTQTDKLSPIQIGSSSWTAVSAGENFSLAIRVTDGALFAWGFNNHGQLGQGDLTNYSSPVQIGSSSYTIVSAGGTHVGAITTASTLLMWGSNDIGQIGDGSTTETSTPVTISGTWTDVSAGSSNEASTFGHTLAIKSNLLFAWGRNAAGQLGLGDISDRASPVQVGISSWTSISAGRDYSMGTQSNNMLFTWGHPLQGELGQGFPWDGSFYSSVLSPVQVGTSSWTAVAAGSGYSGAIRSDGGLFTWGDNTATELGLNLAFPVPLSTPTQLGTSSWTAVTAGDTHMLAITTDGSLYAWGNNAHGELGLGDQQNRYSPSIVGTSSWSMVNAGLNTTMGITTDGSLWAWGTSQNTLTLGFDSLQAVYFPTQVGALSWTAIAGGQTGSHTVALRSDGGLFAWGDNSLGQLGQGNNINTSSPVQIGTSSWTAVAAGLWTSAAIRTDGALFTWGSNAEGVLGTLEDPVTIPQKLSPVQVDAGSSWTNIALGGATAVGIKTSGVLYTWGSNNHGSLGQNLDPNTDPNRSSPIAVSGATNWSSVSMGRFTGAAINTSGQLFMWGGNITGTLGQGDSGLGTDRSSPVQVSGSWTFVSLSATTDDSGPFVGDDAGGHTMAIKPDGTLWGWGWNFQGQLGLGDNTSRSSPVQVGTSSWTAVAAAADNTYAVRADGTLWAWGSGGSPLGQNNWSSGPPNTSSPIQVGTSSWAFVAGGSNDAFAVKSDGTLWAWGENYAGFPPPYGQLGLNFAKAIVAPTLIAGPSWTMVSCQAHNGAIKSDGGLYMWGYNFSGRLGFGDLIGRTIPTHLGTESWLAVSTSSDAHTLAIKQNGTLWAWGTNFVGQLGLSDLTDRSTPVQVGASYWGDISAGIDSSFGISSNNPGFSNALYTWGDNVAGELGDGTTTNRSSPVLIGTMSWSVVSVGFETSAAIRSDGALFTWGFNTTGELGQGDTTNRSSPTQVGSSSWTMVNVGDGASVGAIRIDGRLFTWGFNGNGVLGQGDLTDRSSPTQVGSSSWTMVNVNDGFMVAIRADGALFAWGSNNLGQLGQGDFGSPATDRYSPTQVGTDSWTMAAASGGGYTAAIRTDGALFMWGYNGFGELGQGDFGGGTNRSSPTQVGTDSWTFVSVGSETTAAIRIDGGLFTWGFNGTGQLGDGTTTDRSSPTQVGTDSWTIVSVGDLQSMAAIRSDNKLFTWGDNTNGTLGLGDTANRSSPVQVGAKTWATVDIGFEHMIARRL